ncbi:adenosylcobinamide amidohydrolase [Actinokineospora guangxiensis]|uniref:Adenosylcobinamide amidohydrolase n=1 Tax=Actinokineospora guangxiensis TaxID=1490288 RepID=A0ABW0EZS6_9PSEU
MISAELATPGLPDVRFRVEGGVRRPMLLWQWDRDVRVVSSAAWGGGAGARRWVLNAEVDVDYDRDPVPHLAEIATGAGLVPGTGVGLMTAAAVDRYQVGRDGGAWCAATVGISHPTLAAAPDAPAPAAGTINLVCWVPAPMCDAALVNLVITATEAKVQALNDSGIQATGTATDAVAVCCPVPLPDSAPQSYGGPRSRWGAPLARAVHSAVAAGTRDWLRRG